ncbi:hypothetical protein BaRGS_00006641, partial [Batillaria attramentaria]
PCCCDKIAARVAAPDGPVIYSGAIFWRQLGCRGYGVEDDKVLPFFSVRILPIEDAKIHTKKDLYLRDKTLGLFYTRDPQHREGRNVSVTREPSHVTAGNLSGKNLGS